MARPDGEVSALFEHMCEKYPERDAGCMRGWARAFRRPVDGKQTDKS